MNWSISILLRSKPSLKITLKQPKLLLVEIQWAQPLWHMCWKSIRRTSSLEFKQLNCLWTAHLPAKPLQSSICFLPVSALILKITGWSINPLKKLNQLIQKNTKTITSIYINEVEDDSLLHEGGLKAQHISPGRNQVFKKTMPDPLKDIPNHVSYDPDLLDPAFYEEMINHYKAG